MSLFSDSEGSNSSSDINVMFGSHAVAPNSPTPYTDATQVGSKTLIHGKIQMPLTKLTNPN